MSPVAFASRLSVYSRAPRPPKYPAPLARKTSTRQINFDVFVVNSISFALERLTARVRLEEDHTDSVLCGAELHDGPGAPDRAPSSLLWVTVFVGF